MNDFLASLKADLLDRRLLPLVALVAVALVAAIAYAALGGGSSAATPTAATSRGSSSVPAGLATSQTTPETAVAEVTSGAAVQHHGTARNPFTPLPGVKAKSASTGTGSASTTTSTSPTSSSPSSSSVSSGGSTPTTPSTPSTQSKPSTPSKPSPPGKPKTVYHVAVQFGALPVTATTPLTPYENLKLLTPLPSSTQALIIFRGVTAGGKSATFTLVGEAILHGEGGCLPSATQCEAIDLQSGKSEQLEYLSPTGQVLSYELKVVSITSEKASTASVKYALHSESKAGRELLSHDGLVSIPYLHYAADAGVLVFAGHGAFAARAHASADPRHGH